METNEVYNEGAQNPEQAPAAPKRPALHKSCQDYLDSIPEMVKLVKANSKRFDLLDSLKEKFKECYSYSSCYAPVSHWEVSFQFETFAQAKRVLKYMAENGIKRTKEKVYQDTNYGLMKWEFHDWTIRGYFQSKKENACHYVQVGTKTVEVPIMELQCGEAFDPQFKPAVVETDDDGLPF